MIFGYLPVYRNNYRNNHKFKEMAKSFANFRSTDYTTLLPESLAKEFKIFDIIPVLIDNEVQLILPYNITIE